MPEPIDIHLGKRLRTRRRVLDMSQEKLGLLSGVSLQQIQKYESATNKMSAARLWQLSETLLVPVGYFYEGFSQQTNAANDPGPEQSEAAMGNEGRSFASNP